MTKKSDIVMFYIKQNCWTFIFLLVMTISIGMVAIYRYQHPLVCSSTGKVKEIIEINESYARIKLENEQIIDYPISVKKEITTPSITADPVMNMLYSETKIITEYNTNIKLGDTLCLEYSRK